MFLLWSQKRWNHVDLVNQSLLIQSRDVQEPTAFMKELGKFTSVSCLASCTITVVCCAVMGKNRIEITLCIPMFLLRSTKGTRWVGWCSTDWSFLCFPLIGAQSDLFFWPRRYLPDNRTDVPCKVSAASCGSQVFCRVESVRIDHEISRSQITVRKMQI